MNEWTVLSNPFNDDFVQRGGAIAAALYRRGVDKLRRLAAEQEATIPAIDCHTATHGDPADAFRFWRPELGTVLLGLQNNWTSSEDLQWLDAQMLLAGALCGTVQKAQARYRLAKPLTCHGRLIRSEAVTIAVDADRIVVFSDSGTVLESLHRNAVHGHGTWISKNDPERIVPFGDAATGLIADGSWIETWTELDACLPAAADGFAGRVESAFRLLQTVAPRFYIWSVLPMREVIPRERAPTEEGTSRSLLYNFGAIELAHPATDIEMVEMIVHESSHQYFHMASLLERMTTPAARPHYSAIKQAMRPLERILLGFHAFANVLLAYDALDGAAGLDREECARRRNVVARLVDSLVEALDAQADSGLTDTGRAMYFPLRERIRV